MPSLVIGTPFAIFGAVTMPVGTFSTSAFNVPGGAMRIKVLIDATAWGGVASTARATVAFDVSYDVGAHWVNDHGNCVVPGGSRVADGGGQDTTIAFDQNLFHPELATRQVRWRVQITGAPFVTTGGSITVV